MASSHSLDRREPAPDPPRPLRPSRPRARARARRVMAGRRLDRPARARRGIGEGVPLSGMRPGDRAGDPARRGLARRRSPHGGWRRRGGAQALAYGVLAAPAAPRAGRPEERKPVSEIRAASVLPAKRTPVRGRGHAGHLVLRLVSRRPALAGGRDLPGHLRGSAPGHARDPGPHGGPRLRSPARLNQRGRTRSSPRTAAPGRPTMPRRTPAADRIRDRTAPRGPRRRLLS